MMKKITKNSIKALCVALFTLAANPGLSSNSFVVSDIKVAGLKRISLGTVLNYLPLEVGEEMDESSAPKIIKSLYETGFFQSVELEKEKNVLIIKVIERPTIGTINVSGNKEIPNDKMKEILKDLNLVQGRVFQKSSLERLEKELRHVYIAHGKNNAIIESKVTELTDNRVAIVVHVSEGRVSRIKEINIIGNKNFTKGELLSEIPLAQTGFLTYFTKADQYSKAAFDASLESLRAFYLDRGYLKFKIISSQVLLSPDKKDIFININLEEGPEYRYAGYEIVGKPVLPRQKLDSLIGIKRGEIFSRKKINDSITRIGTALGNEGYGFPVLNAEPKIDEARKEIMVIFVIDPGRHVYVRRVNFHGNTKTGDYVLRNIVRQNESALLNVHNVKESERQLRQLNYLRNINIKTTPVVDTNNQVDLDVIVEEAPSAEATASLGLDTNGVRLNAAFNQYNFLGTGRTIGLSFNASTFGQDYSFNYYNPFYTTSVGRGLSLYFQKVSPRHLDISSYSSDRFGGEVNYNILLGERNSMQFGYGYQGLNIQSVGLVPQTQNFVNTYGRNFSQFRINSGWNRNSYDRLPYPSRGTNQQAGAMVSLPVDNSSLSYFKTSYQARIYYPIYHDWILTLLGNVGYGNGFGETKGLPFFEYYFAGGIAQPGQVRGYDSYSLGPQDIYGRSLGANLLVSGSVGMVLPYPLSRDMMRTTLFTDFGNVYAKNIPLQFTGSNGGPLRFSAGVAVDWRSPFGPLAFSLAKPINKQPTDREEMFQFSLSSSF